MRDIVHGVRLAVAAVAMAVCSSGGVWAAPAQPTLQAAPQTAPPPAKADPGATHGKASPGKPAAQAAPQATAPPAEANSGETHGKASPVKPAAQPEPQAAAPPAEVGHGTASAKTTDERAGKAPAGDPMAKATEAVDLVNRIMAGQALKPARSSVGKSVGETGGSAVRPQKARVAAKVRPRPLLVWDAPRSSDGVALVWGYDLVGIPASTSRVLGVRLTWLR